MAESKEARTLEEQSQLKSLRSEVDDLQKSNATMKNDASSLNSQLSKKDDELAQTTAKLVQLQQDGEGMAVAESKDARTLEEQSQLKSLRSEVADLQKSNATFENIVGELAQVKPELKSLRSQVDIFLKSNATLFDYVSCLKSQLNKKDDELAQTKAKLVQLQEELEGMAEARLKRMRSEVADLQESNATLKKEAEISKLDNALKAAVSTGNTDKWQVLRSALVGASLDGSLRIHMPQMQMQMQMRGEQL
jgi:chromosome segregation ATPase